MYIIPRPLFYDACN